MHSLAIFLCRSLFSSVLNCSELWMEQNSLHSHFILINSDIFILREVTLFKYFERLRRSRSGEFPKDFVTHVFRDVARVQPRFSPERFLDVRSVFLQEFPTEFGRKAFVLFHAVARFIARVRVSEFADVVLHSLIAYEPFASDDISVLLDRCAR